PPAFRAEPCVKLSCLWSQRSFVPNKPLSPPALPSFDALIPSLATNLRSGELSRLDLGFPRRFRCGRRSSRSCLLRPQFSAERSSIFLSSVPLKSAVLHARLRAGRIE